MEEKNQEQQALQQKNQKKKKNTRLSGRNISIISPSKNEKIQTASETSCRCATVNI